MTTRAAGDARASLTAWLFLAPYLALFAAFVAAPVAFAAWMSLHAWDFTLPRQPWVGLDNYAGLLTTTSPHAARFWASMRGTAIFTAASVPLLLVLPLVVALAMHATRRGRTVFRAIVFAPYVLGVAVVAVLWRYLLDANVGLVNHALRVDVAWLGAQPYAWIALVAVTVWWTLGLNAVIYLAALQDVPPELYEAARLEGASEAHVLRHVTLPSVRPVLAFVTTTTLIASFNMFGQTWLLTQGGPGASTRTAIYEIANVGLLQFDTGTASAMAMLFTLALGVACALAFAALRERT